MVVKGGLAGELMVFCVRIVTNWTSYLWLLAAPSSYLLVLALLVTVIAKTISLQALHPPVEWWVLPASMLLDVVVFMGVAGAFADGGWSRKFPSGISCADLVPFRTFT